MSSRNADWGSRTKKKAAGTNVRLEDHVVIDVSPEQAWARLSDVPFVAQCLPGLEASSLQEVADGVYRATMIHSVMGVDATWNLQATITPFHAERRLDVLLEGDEPRLRMTMNGTANVVLQPGVATAGSTLDYTTDLRVEGSLAAMGGPVIRSVMGDSLARFVATVGGQEVARPRGGRLQRALRRLWNRISGRA